MTRLEARHALPLKLSGSARLQLPRWPRRLLAAAAITGLTACASLRPGPSHDAAAASGTGKGGPKTTKLVATPSASQVPTFDSVSKDAKRVEGVFTIWQKDEKVWIELADSDLGAPLFLSPKLASGIGEKGFYGGLMASNWGDFGRPQLVELRRIHNQVQLIARNAAYTARPGSPEARAVQAAFSPSLVGSMPVVSQPHPERKTVLVDASALFGGDMLGLGMLLQRVYKQGYSWDGRNSAVLKVRNKPDELIFEVLNHYATGSISQASSGSTSGAPHGSAAPSTPDTLPDARSLFLTVNYSITRLPKEAMHPRLADQRLGHFMVQVSDFGDDIDRTPKKRYVARWRLEKKDPAAAQSEPVKPITYWIDRDVPEKYRASVRDGILEWNKAFEAIGFKDAIVVKQQADDADFDTLDTSIASVRWMTNAGPSFGAIGPIHIDPRSGEILDADIALESLSSRAVRSLRAQILPGGSAAEWAGLMQARDLGAGTAGSLAQPVDQNCMAADLAGEQLDYALDVLALQSELAPDGALTDSFVQSYIKDTVMHEVGHTLGLRHNFRASRAYSDEQVSDPAFTHDHALTGSVMEYLPVNLAAPGQPVPAPFQTTLGPYDYWAIEYAYRPIDAAQEQAELAKIAARSAEPELAFATDEDSLLGIDPEALQFDLGNDPAAFAAKRFAIARDLLQRLEQRQLAPGEDYTILRRSVRYALRDVARATGVLARQIGGVRTLRDFANTGRDPLQPVPQAQQRAALDLLATQVLSAEGLAVSPALQRRLAPDYLERAEALGSGDAMVATDYAPAQVLAELQQALLAQLMSDGVASRLLDSEAKSDGGSLHLDELYRRIDAEVWSELARPGSQISAARRELQRDHIDRLTLLLLRPDALNRADARSLLRVEARALLPRLEAAARQRGLSGQSRAHLQDCALSLREALDARLVRTRG
jgi:hypothetical protein